VTLNLPLWPRTTVLFANPAALAGLSDEQRGWIQQAAADAAKYSLTTFGEDREVIPMECRNGMKAVLASSAQLSAFRKAFAPVYASLRTDPATASALDEITALKKQVGPVSPPRIPSGCGAGTSAQPEPGPAFPQGVFRGIRTRAAILQAWPNATAADLKTFAAVETFRFENGSFDLVFTDGGVAHCHHGSGRYLVQGAYVVTWFESVHGCPGYTMPSPRIRFRWTYDNKKLSFHVAQPATPLDIVIWTAVPLARIG
jgi:hypothetical protein